MKQIKRSQIEKAIKAAEKEARKWSKVDRGHCYRIMIDTDDAEIWTDTFIDCNSWKQYRSDTISSLDVMAPGGRLGDAIHRLTWAGWEVIE